MIQKFIYILITSLLFSCSTDIFVCNDSDQSRKSETIELMLDNLSFDTKNIIATDSEGKEIPSQITFDNKLIFQVDVPAKSFCVYHVKKGQPQKYDTIAVGAVYPQRLDDLAWESDLAAYRIYGPKLQKSGEKAFGNDIWVKNNTKYPVVSDRYKKELQEGISYHKDNGNGYDGYNVGPTLGAGRTAVTRNDTIVYPYCYNNCVILDNGPIRFTAELSYDNNEKRRISIDAGNFLNHETIWFNEKYDLITGIVLHDNHAENNFISSDSLFISHLETVGSDQIYIAALFKKPFLSSGIKYGHLIAHNRGDSLDYWWGASWNRSTEYPIADFESWNTYLNHFSASLKSPLTIEIRKSF